jgi:hypothetical protein
MCAPPHRPSYCLPSIQQASCTLTLTMSLLPKHHFYSLQIPVSPVISKFPPVFIHSSPFNMQTSPPSTRITFDLHIYPRVQGCFYSSYQHSQLSRQHSKRYRLSSRSASIYLYIPQTHSFPVTQSIDKLYSELSITPRRIACSFLEPIPELRRSNSGKPYRPPRMKTPAPADMVNRVSSLWRPAISRTSSMPMHTSTFSRRAMTLFKRVNSAAVCTNWRAEVDVGEAQRWQQEMGSRTTKDLHT